MTRADPMYPLEDEWGEWLLEDPKDSFETRKHEALVMFERRCRHCKDLLGGIPVKDCAKEECESANFIGAFQPTSLRRIAFDIQDTLQAMAYIERETEREGFGNIEATKQSLRLVLDAIIREGA